MKDCCLWEGPHVEDGKRCEEEGAAEKSCHGQTTIPIPLLPSTTLGQGDVEELGMKELS